MNICDTNGTVTVNFEDFYNDIETAKKSPEYAEWRLWQIDELKCQHDLTEKDINDNRMLEEMDLLVQWTSGSYCNKSHKAIYSPAFYWTDDTIDKFVKFEETYFNEGEYEIDEDDIWEMKEGDTFEIRRFRDEDNVDLSMYRPYDTSYITDHRLSNLSIMILSYIVNQRIDWVYDENEIIDAIRLDKKSFDNSIHELVKYDYLKVTTIVDAD